MANELKEARAFEMDLGLSEDEIAFYDALTDDEIVREVMSDETLKKIAQELSDTIRKQVNVDYNVRANLQAGMRNTIKRLLKKYDYPPKQSRHAIEIVMRQTELMSEQISFEKAMNDAPRRYDTSLVTENEVTTMISNDMIAENEELYN